MHLDKFHIVALGGKTHHTEIAAKLAAEKARTSYIVVLAQIPYPNVCVAYADLDGKPYAYTRRKFFGWGEYNGKDEPAKFYRGTKLVVRVSDPHGIAGLHEVSPGLVEVIDATPRNYEEAEALARTVPAIHGDAQFGKRLEAARRGPTSLQEWITMAELEVAA